LKKGLCQNFKSHAKTQNQKQEGQVCKAEKNITRTRLVTFLCMGKKGGAKSKRAGYRLIGFSGKREREWILGAMGGFSGKA